MGALHDQITAIVSDGGLSRLDKVAQVHAIKRAGWDGVRGNLAGLLPHTRKVNDRLSVTFKDDGSFEVGSTPQGTPFIKCNIEVRVDGGVTYDGLWKVVNPPLLVPDTNGEVEKFEYEISSPPESPPQKRIVGSQKFREDLPAVLDEMLKQRFL